MGLQVGALLGGVVPRVTAGEVGSNQGMVVSIRTALFVGLGAIGPALTIWPFCKLAGLGSDHAIIELTVVCFLGGYGTLALWYGGFDAIKHYVLRLVLWSRGDGPLSYPVFLEEACRLHFMQRAGSGYLFSHRLLQEHFATRR